MMQMKIVCLLTLTCLQLNAQESIDPDRGYLPELGLTQVIKTDLQYVATGQFGAVLTSQDAIRWQPNPQISLIDFRFKTFNSVVWNGSLYLAVGEQGRVHTSSNGSDWEERFTNSFQPIHKAIWNGSSFITVGGMIGTSSDGKTWTETAAPGLLLDVIHENGTAVAVGEDGLLVTSTDLQTWSQRPAFTIHDLIAIGYWQNRFISISKGWEVFTSANGISWTKATTLSAMPEALNTEHQHAVILMQDGLLAYSSDGLNWQERQTGLPNGTKSLIWDGTRYVGVGSDGLLVYGYALDNWAAILRDEFIPRVGAARKGDLFFAPTSDGYFASGCGRSWRKQSSPIIDRLSGIERFEGGFMGVGDGGLVATSQNGYEWTQLPFLNTENLYTLAISPDAIVADGAEETYVRPVSSNDWEMLDFSLRAHRFVWDGATFIGTGPLARFYLSRDGYNWQSSSAGSFDDTNILVGGDRYTALFTISSFIPSISYGIRDHGVGIGSGSVSEGTWGWRWVEDYFLALGHDAYKIHPTDGRTSIDYGWNLQLRIPTLSSGHAYASYKNTNFAFVYDQQACECPIYRDPEHTVACFGEEAYLKVYADNVISYQWRKAGVPIPGATQATLTIPSFSQSDVGHYDCIVQTSCQTATSARVTLQEGPGVTISELSQPPSAIAPQLTASFSCDTSQLTWYWRDVANNLMFGMNQTTVKVPRTTDVVQTIEIVVSSPNVEGTSRHQIQVLSLDPMWVDPNQDGCQNASDLIQVSPYWLTEFPNNNDPNRDGQFDIRDFLYIPTNGAGCPQ